MTVKFNPSNVANRAVQTALDKGVSPRSLQESGQKLLNKQLNLDGVFAGLNKTQTAQLAKAVSVAVDQLAANTESRLDSGVTA